MKNLVIVEASGKVDVLAKKLKSIKIYADVLATVGHVAENPRSLSRIALDSELRETRYAFKEDRLQLLEKIQRAAAAADRIYLAMDDDQEGDVIAHDVAWVLEDFSEKLYRVRLRALSESELTAAFSGNLDRNFKTAAHNGICRRIVDRAIGATFSKVSETEVIPVGRVQSSLLAHLDEDLPEMGRFVIPAGLQDGSLAFADVPVHTEAELRRLEMISKLMAAGGGDQLQLVDDREIEVPAASPWGYEEIVEEASSRLQISIDAAADALQEAYERGKVSYPRTRRNGFTQDAVELASALAKQNRTHFRSDLLPLRAGGAVTSAHESPRPMDEDMLLGRALTIMDAPDAIASLVARNMIECGQIEKKRVLKVEVDGLQLEFVRSLNHPVRSWKKVEPKVGYTPYERDRALLRYMAKHDLGRPSTIVGHVGRFLQRGLIAEDGSSLGLNEKGRRWLAHAKQAGFSKTTSNDMEQAFTGAFDDPHTAATEILGRFGMLESVQAVINTQNKQLDRDEFEMSV